MSAISSHKTVVIIAGPTAVGKTAAAIRVARQLNTEIISADSRQCYRELHIGVARPSPEELAAVRHSFVADHSIQEEVTAAGFENYALKKTNELFADHDFVVMTGGTGLYLKAFCEGFDWIPAVPAGTREQIQARYAQEGIGWLQNEIKQKDPFFFATGEIKNPRRLMRALEVWESTGRSILHFRKGEKVKRDFRIVKIALQLPREELVQRIHQRTDQMMEQGLLEEAKALFPDRHLNALQTVGYQELFRYLKNELSLEEAVALIKKNTRQYAKRQLTWFKKDERFQWISPQEDISGLVNAIVSNASA